MHRKLATYHNTKNKRMKQKTGKSLSSTAHMSSIFNKCGCPIKVSRFRAIADSSSKFTHFLLVAICCHNSTKVMNIFVNLWMPVPVCVRWCDWSSNFNSLFFFLSAETFNQSWYKKSCKHFYKSLRFSFGDVFYSIILISQ